MRSNTLNPHYRVGCNTMAAAIIVEESNNAKQGVIFQISQGKTLRTMCGLTMHDALGEISKPSRAVKPSEWILHDNLRFMGQKADNTATYYGLVPKINGVERPDLAIMSDSTGIFSVTHYADDKDEDGELLELNDALREAVQKANEQTLAEGGEWEDWWNTLAKLIKGKAIGCLTYRGRRYDNKKVYYGTEMVLY